MSKIIIPEGYRPTLGLYDTQTAIGMLKRIFEEKLCFVLNLKRVSAPLFVDPETGLNDDLNGVERPVRFDIKETGRDAVVVCIRSILTSGTGKRSSHARRARWNTSRIP